MTTVVSVTYRFSNKKDPKDILMNSTTPEFPLSLGGRPEHLSTKGTPGNETITHEVRPGRVVQQFEGYHFDTLVIENSSIGNLRRLARDLRLPEFKYEQIHQVSPPESPATI